MTASATTPEREPRQHGKTLIGAGLRSGLVQVGLTSQWVDRHNPSGAADAERMKPTF
jgi:hypothetical protein